MSLEPLVLGIDLGTTGVKVLALDSAGTVCAVANESYPLSLPAPGHAEQDPMDWCNATFKAIRSLLANNDIAPERVRAIGVAGQMHGLVALDETCEVIRPAILWNDQRSAPQCDRLTNDLGLSFLLDHTGNALLPGFTAPKLVWLREHELDSYERVRHVLLPKDYLRFALGSELAMDVSDASGTSVFDCANRRFSSEALAALDLPEAWWPNVHESVTIVDRLSNSAANATGLQAGIALVAGAGDQAASAVGSGIVREGIVSATIGTSGVVFACTEKWHVAPEGALHAFCHAVPNTWHLMGVMLSAAGSFEWFRNSIAPDIADSAVARSVDPFAAIESRAAAIAPGADGLVFLPYLSGERTPHVDPDIRACFLGLTPHHTRDHMARAVLEGVSFAMNNCLDLVRSCGIDPALVRLAGGGAQGPLWRSLLTDIFGCTTARTTTVESTACGAAILAAVASEFWTNVPEASDAVVHETERLDPGPNRSVYSALQKRFDAAYPVLAPWFHPSS